MWWILLLLLLVLFISVGVSWLVISNEPYTNIELTPGMPYEVAGRKYVFPATEDIINKPHLLKTEVIESIREILMRAHKMFDELKIEYHVTGGTLMGIAKHKTIPMPWDDDADICVDWENRDYFWTPDFRTIAARHGLDVRYLKHNTLTHADHHGACVRLQLLGGGYETCDIFFWKKVADQVWKIDSWDGDTVYPNAKEQFKYDDVFPRKKSVVDGMEVMLPHNPEALLVQQYGAKVLHTIIARPQVFSHRFPMQFLRLLWVTSPTA